jgi:hypothetical protein
MSRRRADISCNEHGEREATFVCQHLPKGEGLGFHQGFGDDDPDALFPDAWCDLCEAVRQEKGGWNSRSEAIATISVLCSACYLRRRLLNWPRAGHAEEAELVRRSVEYLRQRQDVLARDYHLNHHERYDWNQDSGQLVFSNQGVPAVVADFQFVGSVSTRTNTWLWSWANESDLESVRSRIREVRAYGEEHRLLRLACAYWAAEEADGWNMAAVAAYLLKAKGAYRSPDGHRFTFLLMTDVRWAQ